MVRRVGQRKCGVAMERDISCADAKSRHNIGSGLRVCGKSIPPASRNQHFFIDLLFYHLKLRAYVVIDLKMKAFEPEFAGR
jgi:predicted nuclease of restriction endonuclease-like (RecB) superfamily